MSHPQSDRGDIIRKILIDYRDRQTPGEIKAYRFGRLPHSDHGSRVDLQRMSDIFVIATSRVDAVIKMYDHYESIKSAVEGYKYLYDRYEDVNDANQIVEMIIGELFGSDVCVQNND